MRIIGCLSVCNYIKYKLFVLLIQAIVLVSPGEAGFERIVQPTSSFARGLSGAALTGMDNIWLNPAAIASLSSFHASVFYSPSPFGLPQLSQYGMVSGYPFQFGAFALGLHTSGFSLYRESFGSLTYALDAGEGLSVGIGVQWHHVAIMNYGSSSSVGIDCGAVYSPVDIMSVGVSLINVNGAHISEDDDIPRMMVTGLALHPAETVTVTADMVKDIRYPAAFRIGAEFSPIDIVTVRGGTATNPSRLFGGFGFAVSSFILEYGTASHADLGLTHSIGVSFSL